MKNRALLTTGILITSISQIASHYLTLEDSIKGLTMGIGIGLIIITLIQHKRIPKA